ncbi:hypothetical protein GA0070613_0578 [Micromonospora inositola]|uniref:Uncharacterized protein n=1 Tax=Micromonospora inositola TaxID=47865 RepID=A0A1C5GYI1_9ACTN|nr:hypothetical protein GA0070613_0578 [Micromonospora inositola]
MVRRAMNILILSSDPRGPRHIGLPERHLSQPELMRADVPVHTCADRCQRAEPTDLQLFRRHRSRSTLQLPAIPAWHGVSK